MLSRSSSGNLALGRSRAKISVAAPPLEDLLSTEGELSPDLLSAQSRAPTAWYQAVPAPLSNEPERAAKEARAAQKVANLVAASVASASAAQYSHLVGVEMRKQASAMQAVGPRAASALEEQLDTLERIRPPPAGEISPPLSDISSWRLAPRWWESNRWWECPSSDSDGEQEVEQQEAVEASTDPLLLRARAATKGALDAAAQLELRHRIAPAAEGHAPPQPQGLATPQQGQQQQQLLGQVQQVVAQQRRQQRQQQLVQWARPPRLRTAPHPPPWTV